VGGCVSIQHKLEKDENENSRCESIYNGSAQCNVSPDWCALAVNIQSILLLPDGNWYFSWQREWKSVCEQACGCSLCSLIHFGGSQ
jgi:hypothetical protein